MQVVLEKKMMKNKIYILIFSLTLLTNFSLLECGAINLRSYQAKQQIIKSTPSSGILTTPQMHAAKQELAAQQSVAEFIDLREEMEKLSKKNNLSATEQAQMQQLKNRMSTVEKKKSVQAFKKQEEDSIPKVGKLIADKTYGQLFEIPDILQGIVVHLPVPGQNINTCGYNSVADCRMLEILLKQEPKQFTLIQTGQNSSTIVAQLYNHFFGKLIPAQSPLLDNIQVIDLAQGKLSDKELMTLTKVPVIEYTQFRLENATFMIGYNQPVDKKIGRIYTAFDINPVSIYQDGQKIKKIDYVNSENCLDTLTQYAQQVPVWTHMASFILHSGQHYTAVCVVKTDNGLQLIYMDSLNYQLNDDSRLTHALIALAQRIGLLNQIIESPLQPGSPIKFNQ